FHLVIPSLPGHGFSGKPRETGWDPIRIAKAWVVLMERLGYSRYVAQGGDWGNAVTEQLALLKPEGLLGIHTNMPATVPPDVSKALATGGAMPDRLAGEEEKAFKILKHFSQPAWATPTRWRTARRRSTQSRTRRSAWRPGC